MSASGCCSDSSDPSNDVVDGCARSSVRVRRRPVGMQCGDAHELRGTQAPHRVGGITVLGTQMQGPRSVRRDCHMCVKPGILAVP